MLTIILCQYLAKPYGFGDSSKSYCLTPGSIFSNSNNFVRWIKKNNSNFVHSTQTNNHAKFGSNQSISLRGEHFLEMCPWTTATEADRSQ